MIRKNIKPAIIKHQPNIRYWKNALLNEPAFLLANGCSVLDEITGNIDQLQQYFTVGINRSFLLFDPAVLFWQDKSLWESESNKILKSTAIRVCRDTADPLHRFHNFRLKSVSGWRVADSPHILYGTGATGPLAFQFAHALGCNPIVLLGYDCKYRDKKTDFYGVNPFHRDHTLKNCAKGLNWLHTLKTDRMVVNCSDNDIYTSKQKLQNVLGSLPPPKSRDFYISLLQRIIC